MKNKKRARSAKRIRAVGGGLLLALLAVGEIAMVSRWQRDIQQASQAMGTEVNGLAPAVYLAAQ